MDGLETIDQTTDTDLAIQDGQQQEAVQQDDAQQPDTDKAEKGEWRRVSPEWSKAIKELRELYPDRADMLTKLRDGYGNYAALNELAPKGLADVRQWKTTIDAVGGPEAAAELMQRAASMDQVDAKIEAGDYTVIAELPETLQKGFYQMLPEALTDLSEKDPPAFQAAVAPHFQAALVATGMGDHLKKMYAAAGDNEPLKELIKQQFDWFQEQTSGAGKMQPGAKSADPQVAKLQEKLATYEKTDDDKFVASIVDSTNKHMKDWFSTNAAVYIKQLNLSESQKEDLKESFEGKLAAKLEKDTSFQKQLGAYRSLKNRNPDTVNTYIQSTIGQDSNAKAILDSLITARYGGMKKKADPPPTTTTTTNGATRVATAPDQSQWDMSKMEAMGYDATVKKGLFYLQGGRSVQLVKQ